MKSRRMHLKTMAAALVCSGVLVLAACGGGGGGGSYEPVAAAPAPTTFTVAGTAATGGVFDNATVTIVASDGTSYGGGATDVTGADGSYSITLPLTAKPPFVVQAVKDDKTLVSVIAEAKDTTTNITPVTNLIASRLSPSGDPAKLVDELKAKPTLFDAVALKTKVAEIVALIKPLMDAVGDSTDPLNGKFVADGTGADKLLDSLSISITPNSATSVNIEVAVKQKLADGAQPEVISFTNTTAPAAALPAVEATNLVPSGTAPLIADFLQRMTACYALPLDVRVKSGGTGASDIIAAACKDIFLGNDPTSFLASGAVVSTTGAFYNLFDSYATGEVFDQGKYEWTSSNGDLLISWRISSPTFLSYAATHVRADTDGKLRLIGNQYKYSGGVNAYHQLRNFINQPAATYYSTGYNMVVNNTLDASGKSIFSKVVVTSPKGGVITLQPSAGLSYLPATVNGATTGGTYALRVSAVYADAANNGNPADADTTMLFASPAATDAEIAAYPAQSSWKFDYYLAGNTTTTPDATQYHKTRARALTIAELKTQPLAAITDADIAAFKANTKSFPTNGHLYVPTPPTGPVVLDWTVPTGAVAPITIRLWGSTTISGTTFPFNDTARVLSSMRTGSIACSPASLSDKHCAAGNYVGGGLNAADVWAVGAAGREFSNILLFPALTSK